MRLTQLRSFHAVACTGSFTRAAERLHVSQPTVTTQVVTLDELSPVLPLTTVYFTPEQRAQQIAERQSGYTLRTAPYVSTDLTPDSVLA